MKISTYIKQNNLSQVAFAALIGVSPQAINTFCNEQRIPRPDSMRKIFIATKGQVTPNDFYDIGDSDANAAADNEMKGTVENV